MCTLSIFKTENGFDVFMNRDERHDRPPETPPEMLAENIKGPRDPQSEGTWVAYNAENQNWGCLLNGYFDADKHGKKSRGQILPELLQDPDPLKAAKNLDASAYNSFRLVIGNAQRFVLCVWNDDTFEQSDFHAHHNDEIAFLTSSSLRQNEVIETRKSVFKNWLMTREFENNIPSFHLSKEPDEETAICMHRDYSRTQSITSLHITEAKSHMEYLKIRSKEAEIHEESLVFAGQKE